MLALQRALGRREDTASRAQPGEDGASVRIFRPPPHPGWQPPQPQPAPFDSDAMHSVDPSTLAVDVLYPLVISAVVPRPIAFVSSLGASGDRNLAPYSYFNVLAHDPPTVAIGCCASRLRPHGKKDTLVNILETGEFVVNIISEWFVEAANHCCGNFDYGEDEMALSGLTPLPSVKVAPPRVREAAVQLECRLKATHEVRNGAGKLTCTIVIGEIVIMHIADGVTGRSPSGKLIVDPSRLRPLSRLGGNYYARTEGIFELPRPDRDAGHGNKPLVYTSNPQ